MDDLSFGTRPRQNPRSTRIDKWGWEFQPTIPEDIR
jgi:hypothetical protein